MANKKLQATITIGGAVASSLSAAFGKIKGQVGQVGDALRNLEGQQRQLSHAIQTFGSMGKNVDGIRAKYATLTEQIDRLRAAHQQLARVEAAQKANLDRRADLRGQIFDTVALGATAAAPIIQAAKFETAMLGVAKQVEGAREEGGKLTTVYHDMAKQVQLLGREIPLATNDLAAMVAAGARMGVAREELIGFTRTAAMMADAFELPADELADNMGKIAGLFKIPIPAIGELADSINFLDDNAISKGGDIIDFLTRTGGVASSVKITGQEMAALGSTLLTLGERSETASTAVNAVFSKLAAADKGTKAFKAAMQEVGLSTREVQKGMQEDSVGTLMKVMEAIGKLPAEKQLGVMVDLVGLEHSDTLAKLANNTEEFRRQLELANSQAAKGSMSREFAARLTTVNAQFQIMKNRTEEVGVNLGTVLLPSVNAVFGAMAPLFEGMADFARENPLVTQAVVGTAVALAGLRVATLSGAYALTFFKGAAIQAAGMAVKMRFEFLRLATAMPAVVAGIRSIGLAFVSTGIGALIAGLAIGAVAIYQNWAVVKSFMVGVFEGLRAGLQPVIDSVVRLYTGLGPIRLGLEYVAGAVASAWGWFTKLLQPVDHTTEQLDRAASAGAAFGQALGSAINFVLTPLKLLIDGLAWVNENILGITSKAVTYSVNEETGRADLQQSYEQRKADYEARKAGDVPDVPPMATARSSGSNYTDNSQNTIQIVQQPGESNADLARRIAEEQERRRAVQRRSSMTDGATAQ